MKAPIPVEIMRTQAIGNQLFNSLPTTPGGRGNNDMKRDEPNINASSQDYEIKTHDWVADDYAKNLKHDISSKIN